MVVEDDDPPKLSDEEIAELRGAFTLFDLDGGGDIDASELGTVMRSLGANPSDAEVKAMIAAVDANGNDSIEFPEFVELMARKLHVTDCEEELKEAFQVFDDQSRGYIGPGELRLIVASLTEGALSGEECDEIVQIACYEDGCDGRVRFDRFAALMRQSKWRLQHDGAAGGAASISA